jgi:hypothetical protein
VPPESTALFVLLLNAVLYIFVIDTIAAVWFAAAMGLPVAIIVAPEYSLLGVIPLPMTALNRN